MGKPMDVDAVVQRIRCGDCPVVSSSYSFASRFDDGQEVPHQVMQRAMEELGLKAAPARGQRWCSGLQTVAGGA